MSLQTVVAEVTSPRPLGTLLLLRLWKEPLVSLVPDRWFCARVTVTGPLGGDSGDAGDDNEDEDDEDVPRATFPCHRWLESGFLELREATGTGTWGHCGDTMGLWRDTGMWRQMGTPWGHEDTMGAPWRHGATWGLTGPPRRCEDMGIPGDTRGHAETSRMGT